VQIAVNRVQTDEQTIGVLETARREGFKSISMDLIYGLPFQTVESFERTLDKAIAIDADRLTVFNYAHLPEIFKPQRRINDADLPEAQVKLDILQMSIEKLTAAGYVYIGMDHFAKPDDELAVAQRDGTLYRNFQGYSTHSECDLIALGATSISMVGDSYAQNLKGLDEYYAAIDADKLAIFRGVGLNNDDKLRRDVITRLICHFELDKAVVEQTHGINFNDYFANELKDLQGMQGDGLLKLEAGRIEVQPAGKLLIRNICMVFDRYLREKQNQRFSKVI
jgi:oxygen-independent coproporphyrinogen-3 oxidase